MLVAEGDAGVVIVTSGMEGESIDTLKYRDIYVKHISVKRNGLGELKYYRMYPPTTHRQAYRDI